MAGMGLLGAAIPEDYGGSGMGPLELCVIAEEAGRVLAPVPLLSSIYLAAELLMNAGTDAQKSSWLARLASGEAIATFAHAERAGPVIANTISASISDGKLNGAKVPVAHGATANMAIVSAREGEQVSLWLVDLHDPTVKRETLANLDPTAPQARLHFENTPAEPLPNSGWMTIKHALDRAAVLLAFEQIGGADRALESARDYALERMAFGRQIGSFQAIKHMLADMYVAATLARSNSYYGAWALSTGAEELPAAAATARVSATEAFLLCAKNNIQAHGGMGFTWEAENHLYYRRANALALALGSQSVWEDRLIANLRDSDRAKSAA
jgi:alkylation response protein AidB-like acyl-CoA dehydrogenase